MNMKIRITCTCRNGNTYPNPHEGITELGWINEDTKETGKKSVEDMILWVLNDYVDVYVEETKGEKAELEPVKGKTKTYLRSIADDTSDNNLLNLPICENC